MNQIIFDEYNSLDITLYAISPYRKKEKFSITAYHGNVLRLLFESHNENPDITVDDSELADKLYLEDNSKIRYCLNKLLKAGFITIKTTTSSIGRITTRSRVININLDLISYIIDKVAERRMKYKEIDEEVEI